MSFATAWPDPGGRMSAARFGCTPNPERSTATGDGCNREWSCGRGRPCATRYMNEEHDTTSLRWRLSWETVTRPNNLACKSARAGGRIVPPERIPLLPEAQSGAPLVDIHDERRMSNPRPPPATHPQPPRWPARRKNAATEAGYMGPMRARCRAVQGQWLRSARRARRSCPCKWRRR